MRCAEGWFGAASGRGVACSWVWLLKHREGAAVPLTRPCCRRSRLADCARPALPEHRVGGAPERGGEAPLLQELVQGQEEGLHQVSGAGRPTEQSIGLRTGWAAGRLGSGLRGGRIQAAGWAALEGGAGRRAGAPDLLVALLPEGCGPIGVRLAGPDVICWLPAELPHWASRFQTSLSDD